MKQAITGYITALINMYSDGNVEEKFVQQLNDLLDYVADLKEENREDITRVVLNNNIEITKLQEYIKELEESCENNNEVTRQQWEKIVRLNNANRIWQNTCNLLIVKLESM
ncbi:hypothetical protein FDC45_13105 [Clostridium botulinum]|uniref:Uncharacterized protein n=1 Tax=Clostridium botulinum TaxID=1491 RepID=A0A846J5N7_CLOBO|nr:hypothetical protein [Clostridium botulinum]ACA55207.1 conserved hypothetical protein [Clostridium botulinum A3 str. Loch Maree]NFH66161.1 hypothetical protein [Clostridium botulinum]NFJ08692.1 hypothetical protein [Clostridium botulinum]NFK15088.1 hypothetical protein [Clostridium botulinum]NFM93048.1 hypothetical protein [Clostridium botulinum]